MYGFGEPSGDTPDSSLGPPGGELNVSVDYFAWGWGDYRPEDWVIPPSIVWDGMEHDWGFGDPETLADDHILWLSPTELPDDGGEIITLVAPWPEIGPYRVKCIQTYTGQKFPEATSPLPFCNSPIPGNGGDCYTNILEEVVAGVIAPTPGTKLKFVLPILPPGVYSVELTPPNGLAPITLQHAMEIVWRNRAVQVYMIRNRWPMTFEAGQRSLRYEDLLGYDPESEEEIT
jgi:hypothetical protein